MREIESRQIRVFISSTFRDMKEERDHLVKFTFPQLRKLCESRGVTWGEVDLRWGVTTEQAAEGRVLPICLEEIKRCRPYFIGLLGERYGWVPDTIPPEVIEREPWLREHAHGHKSVTEMEILHGVLNNPDMAEHAFFYFRDRAYIESLPQKGRKDFTAEGAEDAERLHDLKQRIRQSGFPVHEDYPDPNALGKLVLADLTAVIDKLFPEGSQPDPLDREAMDHEAYAQSRERVYIARPDYFAKLDAHADGAGDQPLVILGESGSGKSALLANWVTHYRQTHPDVLILQHYIGATPYSADWAAMLRRIMGEFKRHFNIQQDIPDKTDALRSSTFANWLHMAAAKGRVVLVLDALNQLEDRDGAPDLVWLPPVLPENVRLIVSTLPGRPLNETRKRRWPTMEVEMLSQAERERLIGEHLSQYAKVLSPARVQRIASTPQSGNPLYLHVLLDELRFVPTNEELEERIKHYLQAGSPRDLYRKVIERWEQDYGRGTPLVRNTLALLWAARRGLSETERLYALSKDGRPLARAVWSPLFLAMSDALVNRGGLLTFAHDFLRLATQDAYLPTEKRQRQAHLRLADYFEQQPSGLRRTDELPWQLAQAGAWERLQALLTDRAFLAEAWERNEFEVRTFWTQIEAGSPLRMTQAYHAAIQHPETQPDRKHLWLLSLLLGDTGHPEEALRLRSRLVEHCRATGDWYNLQLTLGAQAEVLSARGDLDKAMVLYQEQEQICRQWSHLDGLQASLGSQALILWARGNLEGAMALHQEEERICRRLGNLAGLQRSLGHQANVLYSRGSWNEAMALYQEQERAYRQLGNLDGLQVSLGCQANVLSGRGDLEGAMALYQEEERLCRQLGNLDSLQRTLGNRALILQDRGDLDGALVLHQEKERICRQLGRLDGLALSLGNQALVLYARGDLDGALARHKEEEHLCRQLGDLDGLSRTLGNQAVIWQDRGDLDTALALYQEAERLCRQVGDLNGLQDTLGNQANVLSARGDLDGAMTLYQDVERISRQSGNLASLVRSLTGQSLVLRRMGRAREGLPLAERAHQLAISHGYTSLARQIEPLLNDMRRAVQGDGECRP
jgi:tetratricopeptide (TPR) repeat protein